MIKTIRGNPISVWLSWLNKELTPPYAEQVAANEDVRVVLHAFRELILKVKKEQEKDIQSELERYIEDVL